MLENIRRIAISEETGCSPAIENTIVSNFLIIHSPRALWSLISDFFYKKVFYDTGHWYTFLMASIKRQSRNY